MATPLVLKAVERQEKIFGTLMYRHILSFNVKTKQWKTEANNWKLIPFYFVAFGIVFFLGFGLCMLHFLRFILSSSGAVSGFVAAIFLAFAAFSVLCWGMVTVFVISGDNYAYYHNVIVNFEQKTLLKGGKLKITRLL